MTSTGIFLVLLKYNTLKILLVVRVYEITPSTSVVLGMFK